MQELSSKKYPLKPLVVVVPIARVIVGLFLGALSLYLLSAGKSQKLLFVINSLGN